MPPSLAFALVLAAVARPVPLLHAQSFTLARPSEVTAVVLAGCEPCSWGERGREAAVLTITVDGGYSQDLMLFRGAVAEYRVGLGTLTRGEHRLRIALDPEATAPEVKTARVLRMEVTATPSGALEHTALAHAPVLHERPSAHGRFSDVPLLMWYETEPTPRGLRIRYSVVFSNEDGGTPADRLMATWGRLTDIEFVYGVELDAAGRIREESYQGPEHKILPFRGLRQGRHPRLYVVTDNNMVSDHGEARRRYAPAPFAFDLARVSREAVMDASPWTYRVSAEEARREGRVVEAAVPGSKLIPDPRRFAYLEACAQTEDATLAFGLGVPDGEGGIVWHDSDGPGLPEFRIARSADNFPNGCFRGAVALPPNLPDEALRLRFRAFTRQPREGEAPLPPGSGRARLVSVNKLFRLGPDDLPGPSLFAWQGDVALAPDGPPVELPVEGRP